MTFLLYTIGWYAVLSLITFCIYAWDKHRARVNKWRVKERTLHIFELLGGWPGAFAAQRLFHHKWQKTGFMRIFWGIVALHVLLWGAVAYLKIHGP
jgi:uncharacterized membrane protein YsdA (DUF1294 family)